MKAVFIIAKKEFRDEELFIPLKIMQDSGVEIKIASTSKGVCIGKFGGEIEAEISLNEVEVDEFDAIIFIGGAGAVAYQNNNDALNIAREAVRKGRILSAICIAPTILAVSGVIKGKKATVWNGDGKQGKFLEKNGAIFIDKDVVEDGQIITANGPQSAEQFGKTILKKYNETS